MAKRNKAKFASKSRKSSLRVEALEQRQLLATVIGSAVEVASNISLNGNVFDQVLLTGAAVTVMPDPGQIARVSFLDNTGDIVQAEFAGSGKFRVTLEDLKLAGSPGYLNANPTQTFPSDVTGSDGTKYTKGSTINYAQGLASIFVDNPEFDTNVSVFSAGLLTNAGFFAGQAKQGGNHFADIARIVIVGDPTNEAAYNNFGGIRAANAIFAADNGVVGIRAENIAVQDTVIIGDLDASGAGVPTLVFHPLSQFQQVKVAGGDLVQSNGSTFNTTGGSIAAVGGFNSFISIDGARSDFNPAATKQANIDSGAFMLRSGLSQEALALSARNQFVTMEGDWSYDLSTGKATQTLAGSTYTYSFSGTDQTALNKMFSERSYSGNLAIKGDLGANLEINLGKVAGTLDYTGNVLGRIEANGLFATIGALKINGNLLGEVFVQGNDRTLNGNFGAVDQFINKIGSVTVTGNVGSTSATGAYIIAETIGDVNITGNLSGLISTNTAGGGGFAGTALSGTNYTDYTGSIGNVSIGGDINSGSVQGFTGIGNINVGGNIIGAGSGSALALPGIFVTSAAQNAVAVGQSAANLSVGKTGTITVVGDVDLANNSNWLVNIAEEGNHGDISIQGNGLLGRVDNNDFLNIGVIAIANGFGNANSTTGSITIADAKSNDPRGTDIDFGGVIVGYNNVKATGKIGAITITGKGEDTDLMLSGLIGGFTPASAAFGDTVEVTSVTATGFEDIVMAGNIQASKVGPLTLTPIAGVGGTNDDNNGAGTGIATSVTINGSILLDDGVANKGETFAGLTLNLGTTNSTVTVAGQILATDFLKGTGSSVGPIALTARAVNFNTTVRAETIGNTTLTAGSSGLTSAPTYVGLIIGNVTATGGNSVTLNGQFGSDNNVPLAQQLGVNQDRTESVGNFTVSTTGTQGITFGANVDSDLIGTITLNAGQGTITFGNGTTTGIIDARSYQGVTGTYGAITATSSNRGNIVFNGDLAGTGGAITLTTGTSGTVSGDITIGTIFRSGAAGNLTATTAGLTGTGDAGNITYAADVEGGSIGTTTLQSTVNGNITYGGPNAATVNSHFAGNVGAVTITTKDVGTVFYTGAFATTADSNVGGSDSNDDGLAVGAVTISTEKGNVGVNPFYDRRVNSTGALSVTTTEGDITYAAQSVGNGGGGNVVANSIAAGNRPGSIGLVTLLTTGVDGDILVTAQLESTSFGGLSATTQALDTVTPATTSTVNFTNADIWAASVGPITINTAEGAINVDAASSFRGFTNGTGTSTSVANINATVAAKGALTFNALVEATSNRTAADNTGTMTINDITLTGNSTGNISFGGIVRTGIYDNAANIALLDGLVDQGTIGKITFNGNTTINAATAQFGTQASQATLQPLQGGFLQNGQFALGTSSMGAFTVNGDFTAIGGTGADGLLRAQQLASFTVTGATTLIADGTNVIAAAGSVTAAGVGLIFVPQLGALSFGGAAANLTATAASPVFVAHDIASIAFNSTQTNLNGGTVFIALDATSDLDTIGTITGTGRVVGNTVASNTNFGIGVFPRGEIEASSIGNVSITATVDGSFVNNAVTNLDLRASNLRGNPTTTDQDPVTVGVQTGSHSITSEAITADGANVQNFAIGNIAITANQTGAFTNTSVFGGTNSFVANGKLGNITLVGNISGTAQPAMFGAATDSAWFTVGDGDAISNNAQSGTDFDGNGLIVGTAELASDFTGGSVAVGNIFVNVDNSSHVLPPIEDFDLIGGTLGGQTDGFAVLVGVQLDTLGVDGVGQDAGATLGLGDRIDTQLFGRIGSITMQNGQIANQANVEARATVAGLAGTAGFGAVIAVAGDGNTATAEIADLVNDVNPLGVVSMNEDPLTNTAVVGADVATPAVGDQNKWDDGEVLVYVL